MNVQGHKSVCNDAGELCLYDRTKQAAWIEHYECLLNVEFDWDPDYHPPPTTPTTPPTHPTLLTLLIIDWFLPLSAHIPINFYYLDYIVIAKSFRDLAEGTMALIFMAGCSNFLLYIQLPLKWLEKTR